jgi:hypothetical protein
VTCACACLPPPHSGWYLCVESGGGSFEARATVRANKFVKAFDRELPGADVSIVTLKVGRAAERATGVLCTV